jgi:hypothetical protein
MSAPNLAARAERAEQYVASIRNAKKRAYAHRFLRYLRNGVTDDIGSLPGDTPQRAGELSYMAAQAVEMNLRAIWRGER